ncbi:MAG: phage Gp37/Gp68 family protein [Patescibacteria group bacterium]|nr:phage Gp37/Gp68 family protein [Patescibacteria group bacterium]
MAETTKIEWTDSTFNPWRGCTKVSEGCAHCYAERGSKRNPAVLGAWGPNGTRILAAERNWLEPLAWDRLAAKKGKPNRIFCASLADVFEDWQGQVNDHLENALWWHPTDARQEPRICDTGDGALLPHPEFRPYTLDEARARLWRLIEATPHLTWQLVTKRPENARRMAPPAWREKWPANVWLLASVESQAHIGRIIELANVPAKVRGVSAEPLLGPLILTREELAYCLACGTVSDSMYACRHCGDVRTRERTYLDYLDWVIVGGESGHEARPMHPDWARSLRDQCQAAKVAFFFGQWGEFGPEQIGNVRHTPVASGVPMDEPVSMFRVGKKAAGRLLEGREWSEYPAAR